MLTIAYRVNYPISYNETNIADAGGDIAQLWDDIGYIEIDHVAACRFCGQVRVLDAAAAVYGMDENERATRKCNCPEARAYVDSLARQERKKNDRVTALENAAEVIDEMLEDGAVGFGPITVKAGVREALLNSATLVYDGNLTSASLNITEWVTVKITRSAKGKLTLQRNDKAVSKQELNN